MPKVPALHGDMSKLSFAMSKFVSVDCQFVRVRWIAACDEDVWRTAARTLQISVVSVSTSYLLPHHGDGDMGNTARIESASKHDAAVQAIRHFQARESDLLQDAFCVDIGVGD